MSRRCDQSACSGFRIAYRWAVHRCSVLASSFGRYDLGSLGLRSDAGVSLLRPVPSFVRCFVRSFRRGLVRSLGPIVFESSALGTRLSSDSHGLSRDSTDGRSTFVAPVLTWDT